MQTSHLQQTFPGDPVTVADDSARHAGHAGAASGAGHYRVAIDSDRFVGLSRPARHRLVYDAVQDWMPERIHALSISARTRAESAAEPG